jgi:hypothetical protein
MSAPTSETPLKLEEVERLRSVVQDLSEGRTESGVVYPSERNRQAAQQLARSLREEPDSTLRALKQALRRVELDLREAARQDHE